MEEGNHLPFEFEHQTERYHTIEQLCKVAGLKLLNMKEKLSISVCLVWEASLIFHVCVV